MSYDALASCYDSFVGADYDDISALISSVLYSFDISQGKILDLACGTGEITKRFCELGFDMTGLDLSENMLLKARKKCDAEFVKGDMTNFSFEGKFSAVICTLDSINHLESMDKIKKAFDSVYKCLDDIGLFIFDMNSIYKHREILSDNSYVYEDSNYFLTWRNEYDEELSRVKIVLDLFSREGNGYKRESESFFEYDYALRDICSALKESGFSVIDISGEYDMEEIKDDTERYFIIAGKV